MGKLSLSLSLSGFRSLKNRSGFTLVELMIVIGIIGMLAASLYPSLSSYLARGRDTKKISEIKQLHTAFINYFLDKSTYFVVGAGADGSGQGYINYTGLGADGMTMYSKSIALGLKEAGYMGSGMTQKFVSNVEHNPTPFLTTPNNPCSNRTGSGISGDLYLFYADNYTGQYSVTGYLENPKQSDIDNIKLAYEGLYGGGMWGTCGRYGFNYAVGKN